jgi:hypothetical protein
LEGKLKALVFISPEVQELHTENLPSFVTKTPMLLTWAKDDPRNEFSESNRWLSLFKNVDSYYIERVAQLGMHKLVANIPENIRYDRKAFGVGMCVCVRLADGTFACNLVVVATAGGCVVEFSSSKMLCTTLLCVKDYSKRMINSACACSCDDYNDNDNDNNNEQQL